MGCRMCEPENTEISRTIEKELLNQARARASRGPKTGRGSRQPTSGRALAQVDESWALQRKKALKDGRRAERRRRMLFQAP